MARERRDADRRSRQCAKFARLIKIARLVMGNGRWGPEDLAREIECSPRTIFRDVEILSAAGVPIFFDKAVRAYRVREGFRFSGLDPKQVDTLDAANPELHDLFGQARRLLRDGEAFLVSLRDLCDRLDAASRRG
jgi:predicted DNA-binding transcriptional regulator YafY